MLKKLRRKLQNECFLHFCVLDSTENIPATAAGVTGHKSASSISVPAGTPLIDCIHRVRSVAGLGDNAKLYAVDEELGTWAEVQPEYLGYLLEANDVFHFKFVVVAAVSPTRIPDDRTSEVCSLLARPFTEQIEDSVDGLRRMLALQLPTRLPMLDASYNRMSGSLKEFYVPYSELPAERLSPLIAYAFLGSTKPRSGSSEAAVQVVWDDLVFKPVNEVVDGSGVSGIFIHRNRTDSTGTTLPDMAMSCGELVYYQEEKKDELFVKLRCLSRIYMTSYVRRFIVGVSTAGRTVAYYALDRERRQPPVLICGPIIVGEADQSTTLVLQCSFNCLRFVLTVDAERVREKKNGGPVLGLTLKARTGSICRTITFFPGYVKKTITPFADHEACGFTTLEHVRKAYTQCNGGWGKAWSVEPPVCDPRGTYKVEVHPVGMMKHPESEHELKLAIRAVLGGLKMLHGMGVVHRDVRWPNVMCCEVGWFIMDFETAWAADEVPRCLRLAGWGDGMPLRDGRYTRQCDLWQVGKLCAESEFNFSTPAFTEFRHRLLTITESSELTVDNVLDDAWLQF